MRTLGARGGGDSDPFEVVAERLHIEVIAELRTYDPGTFIERSVCARARDQLPGGRLQSRATPPDSTFSRSKRRVPKMTSLGAGALASKAVAVCKASFAQVE